MWLSKQMRKASQTVDADLGTTTITGEKTGVVTRGELRDLPVYGPGGYAWLPENQAAVLVIKGGPGGEEQCVAAARQSAPEGMQPGEVFLYSPGGNSIYLQRNGTIWMQGQASVNGQLDIHGTLTINGREIR